MGFKKMLAKTENTPSEAVLRQFNIEVQFVKSVNYTFEQSL